MHSQKLSMIRSGPPESPPCFLVASLLCVFCKVPTAGDWDTLQIASCNRLKREDLGSVGTFIWVVGAEEQAQDATAVCQREQTCRTALSRSLATGGGAEARQTLRSVHLLRGTFTNSWTLRHRLRAPVSQWPQQETTEGPITCEPVGCCHWWVPASERVWPINRKVIADRMCVHWESNRSRV